MNEIITKIEGELEAFKEKKRQLTEELRKEFPNLIKPLLQESETINSISWAQYTPYFNDGEECIFNSYAASFDINGESRYHYGDDNDEIYQKKIWRDGGYKINEHYNKKEGDIVEELKKILSSIPDEFYKELFGDHAKITITRNGEIDVEGYEHD